MSSAARLAGANFGEGRVLRDQEIWLCLSGGNALGAYHAGVYEAFFNHHIEPVRIAGASIGAVSGALIVGNQPNLRIPRLREFWETIADDDFPFIGALIGSEKRRSVFRTLMSGRPSLFRPSFSGFWSAFPWSSSDESLFDPAPQRKTLMRLIDFELLNQNIIPFIVTAVDVQTGEDIAFDSRSTSLSVDHLMASTALPVVFPPVEIDGRILVDPGISANLPLRALLSDKPSGNPVCICLDLFPANGIFEKSLDDILGRTTDILFASQTRHAFRELKAIYDDATGVGITIIHAAYDNEAGEVGMKTFEFTRSSIQARWQSGYRDGVRIVEALKGLPERKAGLDIWSLSRQEDRLKQWIP